MIDQKPMRERFRVLGCRLSLALNLKPLSIGFRGLRVLKHLNPKLQSEHQAPNPGDLSSRTRKPQNRSVKPGFTPRRSTGILAFGSYLLNSFNVGALMIRIRFWAPTYYKYNYNKEPREH